MEQTNENHNKVLAIRMLEDSSKSTFVMNNEVYGGNIAFLAKEYVQENPSKKFRTWLHDKGLFIGDYFTPIKTKQIPPEGEKAYTKMLKQEEKENLREYNADRF